MQVDLVGYLLIIYLIGSRIVWICAKAHISVVLPMNETVRASIIVDYSSDAKGIYVTVRSITSSINFRIFFVILTRQEVAESITCHWVSIIVLATVILRSTSADLIVVLIIVLVALLRINVQAAVKIKNNLWKIYVALIWPCSRLFY